MSNAQVGDVDDVHPADFIEAKFQGGTVLDFHKYVADHFDTSKASKGKMVASFTISESGEITDIRIVEITTVEAAQEFIRILKAAPKWEPAKKGGKPASMKIKLPLVYN
ncbi:energy transducer TonB [Flavobacterium silvaticum]|uniref:TonB C-terminal domain-containing protein n=1 Tax=Flavobacterium silvaticum TaxID=1852020 RepID=A0A972JGV0_9FLAO|nr:energy transducer TonB [Flavobacterium silvaticum]NMH27270.1 hypothetical protein [Flavobacterium silvaticum]